MLPPPHWSPTGNSGTWIWDEQGEVNPRTDEARACWRFHDDVYGRVVTDKDLRKVNATKLKATIKSKSWIDKIKFWRNKK